MPDSNVQRLPVQHRKRPHCESCGREIDFFRRLQISRQQDEPFTILKLSFHVECPCGSQWQIDVDGDAPRYREGRPIV